MESNKQRAHKLQPVASMAPGQQHQQGDIMNTFTDKRQHEALNHAYSLGWTLDHWEGVSAYITHDTFPNDLYVQPNGTVINMRDAERAKSAINS